MGTTYSIVVERPAQPTITQSELAKQVQATLEAVNGRMSTYLPHSELSRFNRSGKTVFQFSPSTATVIRLSLQLAQNSRGAFDPTVGPLVRLWGFDSGGRRTTPPSDSDITRERHRVGFHKVRLTATQVRREHSAVELNLNAIAKGYAVDQVVALFTRLGLSAFMVEVGGEVRVGRPLPGRKTWRIAIEKPAYKRQARGYHRVLELRNMALATSGDYRNFFRASGRSYSHILDPRTGRPVQTPVVSASVAGPECALADGLATALLVLSVAEGRKLVRGQPGYEALWLLRDGPGKLREVRTQKFPRQSSRPAK